MKKIYPIQDLGKTVSEVILTANELEIKIQKREKI